MQEPQELGATEMHSSAEERRRKDKNNMISKQRRSNISSHINDLETLLPKNNDQYYEVVRDRDERPNQCTILKSSVVYIQCLKHEIHRLKQNENHQKQIEYQNSRLLMRVQELEMQAKSHGLPVSDFYLTPITVSTNNSKSPSPLSQSDSSTPLISDIVGKIPDVVSEEATSNLSRMEDVLEDEHPVHSGDHDSSNGNGSDHLNNVHHQHSHHHNYHSSHSSSLQLQHHGGDPLLSSYHTHSDSVDLNSCIGDSLFSTYIHYPLPSPHRSHIDSIPSSPDSDALVIDYDVDA